MEEFKRTVLTAANLIGMLDEYLFRGEGYIKASIKRAVKEVKLRGHKVLGVYIAGGAVANVLIRKCKSHNTMPINDIDVYVFIDGEKYRKNRASSVLRTHSFGKFESVVEGEDEYGMNIRHHIFKDKMYRVEKSYSYNKIFNIILCSTWENHIPTAEELAKDFDINVCQAAIDLRTKEVFVHNDILMAMQHFFVKVNILRWHSPVQSLLRAAKKELQLYGRTHYARANALETFAQWLLYEETSPQVFGKKFVELYYEIPELHKYFRVERCEETRAFKAVWDEGFAGFQTHQMAIKYLRGEKRREVAHEF